VKLHGIVAFVGLMLAAGGAWAQSSGTVEGTLTLNGKTIRLGAVRACIERHDIDDNEPKVVVLMTGEPVDPPAGCGSDELQRLAASGGLAGVRVTFDVRGKPFHGTVYHGSLSAGFVPAGFDHRFEPKAFDERHVAGRLHMADEGEFAGDRFRYDATFAVELIPDPFVLAEAERAALAAMKPGTASGAFTVGGRTSPLVHAYAVERKDFHDQPKRLVLVLSDAPIPDRVLLEGFGLQALARDGRARAVEVTLDAGRRPAGGQLFHERFFSDVPEGTSLSVSVSGMHHFVPLASGADAVAGRVFTKGLSTFLDETFHYTALFHARVVRKPPPTHVGAKAARSGPGKAVAAFFKAVQKRDKAELKRWGGPELAAELDGPDGVRMLEMMAEFFGPNLRIVEVTETGDSAEVVAADRGEGASESTTLRLIRIDGAWRIAPP
jgi:hypothetical protein